MEENRGPSPIPRQYLWGMAVIIFIIVMAVPYALGDEVISVQEETSASWTIPDLGIRERICGPETSGSRIEVGQAEVNAAVAAAELREAQARDEIDRAQKARFDAVASVGKLIFTRQKLMEILADIDAWIENNPNLKE